MAPEIPQRVLLRIWTRLAPPDANGCRRYLGTLEKGGYGVVGWGTGEGRKTTSTTAHRVAYTATHGPIPEGLEVDHICFVTDCCTPEHLQLLTPEENKRRRAPKGLPKPPELARARTPLPQVTHCPRGHSYAEHGVLRWQKGRPRAYHRCQLCYSATYRRKAASQAWGPSDAPEGPHLVGTV